MLAWQLDAISPLKMSLLSGASCLEVWAQNVMCCVQLTGSSWCCWFWWCVSCCTVRCSEPPPHPNSQVRHLCRFTANLFTNSIYMYIYILSHSFPAPSQPSGRVWRAQRHSQQGVRLERRRGIGGRRTRSGRTRRRMWFPSSSAPLKSAWVPPWRPSTACTATRTPACSSTSLPSVMPWSSQGSSPHTPPKKKPSPINWGWFGFWSTFIST